MELTLHHSDSEGNHSETTIQNPEFVDVLCNINDVVVDGDIYNNVSQARLEEFDTDDTQTRLEEFDTDDTQQSLTATEVRAELDRMNGRNPDEPIPGFSDSIEQAMKCVVEEGGVKPYYKLTTDLDLTLRQRLTGHRTQNMTAVFVTGLLFGAALERDIPIDTDLETQWREKQFTLPEPESDD
jgi:hypothetical protein